jgi:cysteine desulfurase
VSSGPPAPGIASDAEAIYLDYNATTPVLPEVLEAMLPFFAAAFGNPSSGHVHGRRARDAVESAREEVALSIGCAPDEIVFCSGGTEANNLALFGLASARPSPGRIVTSVVEHPATRRPCERLGESGWKVHALGVDRRGRIDLDEAAAALASERGASATIVTVMHANNEVGTLQPIARLSEIAHRHGAVVHTDAAQSLGKIDVDVRALGVDLLSIAGHKLYAPKGVGALYVRRGTKLLPHSLGASHERGLRPGTENVASIVGLGRACAIARRDLAEVSRRLRRLRERLLDRLRAGAPCVAVNGPKEPSSPDALPNTLSVRFPGARGSRVLARAPEIAASTGSACHDGNERASSVLLAMGLSNEEALATVRLSLGRGTTEDDVDRAAASLIRAYKEALVCPQ